jgi:hypothetical protein
MVVVLITSHDNKGVLAYSFALVSQVTSGNVLRNALKDMGTSGGCLTLNIDGRNNQRQILSLRSPLPLIHGGFSEQERRSFDSTCKKLNRFLAAHAHINQK